ncbi:MAG: hypothetical protein ACE5OQ_11050 [Woeseia sp.]
MRPIASWLVARPERAIFILIATFLTPITQILGSAVLVLLTLSRGLGRAALASGIAAAAILVLALASKVPLATLFQVVLTIWIPGMALAVMLQRMRSLTLVLQTTVLVEIAVVVGLYVALGDPASHWREMLKEFAAVWRDAGLQQESDMFMQLLPFAAQMTGIVVSVGWLLHVVAFLAGYAAYVSLPGQSDAFGRFSDLNFGRVLAIALALTSIAAMLSAAVWLQNFAFVLFVIFWLQGLAVLHWLRRQGRLPTVALAGVYVLTVLLSPLLVTAVGLVGYTDAWFDYRPRIAKK